MDKIPASDIETPRGPQSDPGYPDRSLDRPVTPPIIDKGDNKNPNDPILDPTLLPIGDPAAMA